MECNKDEALRAKQIAENKMQGGDFTGALKIAMKARRLLPDIENIAQLIAICEVHCAAQNKLAPSEMDWYGVLLTERFSDEATIKKQYRKLALLLHPDKNKFAGAEAAFKLIGEANRVLNDPAMRSVYDMKCRASMRATVPKPSTQQSNGNEFAKDHDQSARYSRNGFNSQPSGWNSRQQVEQQTFWTSCPHCLTRFQYYRTIVNATLRCQHCSKSFTAREMGPHGVPQGYSWTTFNNQKEAPNKGSSKAACQSKGGKPCARQKDKSMKSDPVSMTKCAAGMFGPAASQARESQFSATVGSKRARLSVPDSRENRKTGSGEDMKDANVADIGADSSGPNAGIPSRRSSRQKQHVSYSETLHDNDSESPSKRAHKSESYSTIDEGKRGDAPTNSRFSNHSNSGNSAANMGSQYGEVKNKASGPLEGTPLNGKRRNEQSHGYKEETSKSDTKSKANDYSSENPNDQSHAAEILYPDPEFNNFDKDKGENCFAVNQIWAIYDPTDGMPRFYARVKKVFSPGFKLLITWLEANPDDPGEIDWNDAELPVACGKFKLGKTQKTKDRLMFSHQIDCIKGSSGGTYLVFPKKGEIWAIFNDWDIGWSSNPEKHSKYDFEFVEVWSDFVENVGIEVAYLGKVKGFVSLFQHTMKSGISAFCVPPNELYRFSHRIPSFKMSGHEREGVPVGSFELDPAGLPINLLEIRRPDDTKVYNGILNTGINSSFHGSSEHEDEQLTANDLHKPMMDESKNAERVSSILRRSPRASNRKSMDHDQLNTSPHRIREEDSKDMGHSDINQQEGSAAACQANERFKTPRKHEKNNCPRETFNVRRSPRDLTKKNAQVDAAQSATGETADKRFAQSVGSASSSCKEKLHPKVDGSSSDMKGSAHTSDMRAFCYDVNEEKPEKFQCDQIWALYDEKDRMPKIYAKIMKIEYAPDFRLHVALLEPCSPPKGTNCTVSCGTFKVKSAKTQIALRTAFSHQVRVEPKANNRYEIYPRKGEVWALYEDQNCELNHSNLGRGECCIVEILADSDKSIQVVILTRLGESKPFFKAYRSQRSKPGIVEIPRAEVGRFSHQIPAKVDNALFRGCWELDMSSIPGCVVR